VKHKTREVGALITSRGPKYPNNELVMGGSEACKVVSMSDGTTSIVQVTLHGEPIGTGIAKRHPADPRNNELGMALAMVRAFTEVAMRYTQSVDRILYPAADPSIRSVKQLKKLIKADAVRRHDIKRKAAREAHREIMGWDHTNYSVPGYGTGAGE